MPSLQVKVRKRPYKWIIVHCLSCTGLLTLSGDNVLFDGPYNIELDKRANNDRMGGEG